MKAPLLPLALLLLAAPLAAQNDPKSIPITPQQRAALEARVAELAKQRVDAASAAQAGPAPQRPSAGTVEATLVNLAETRVGGRGRGSTSTATLTANFTFSGTGIDPAASIRRVNITRVIDDRDRPVTATARGNTALAAGAADRAMQGQGLRGAATLSGVERDAISLKVIEGEIELFSPAAGEGSQARLPVSGLQPGRGIDHPMLRPNGIEVIPLDRASYDALALPVPVAAAAAQAAMVPDFAASTVFYIRDSGGRLVGSELQDAAGARLGPAPVQRTDTSGTLAEFRLGGPLPAGAQLVLTIAVPGLLKVYTFRLENVALP